MSSYKVPQDVEADDKLLGPFSFRQFVYLMIVAVSIGLGWLFFTIFPPLVIAPLPFVVFFGALALPLRKDQPMEIYMAALLSFYLKPRRRFWDPDGIETLVQIAAPRTPEIQRTKNISSTEAEQRLRYLSDLSDTHGWSVRGIHNPSGSSLNTDVYNEAQQTQDLLDNDGTVAQNLNYMISQSDERRHQQMLSQFQSAAASPTPPPQPQYIPPPDPYTVLAQPQPAPTPVVEPVQQPVPQPVALQPQPLQSPEPTPAPQPYVPPTPVIQDPFASVPAPQFNPYPASMNQTIIQPLGAASRPAPSNTSPSTQTTSTEPQTDPTTTSAKPVSPDIMKLASNADLSIETIAREAHRISEKEANLTNDNEVFISLR